MKRVTAAVFTVLILVFCLQSVPRAEEHGLEHHGRGHHHHANELGISGGYVYMDPAEESALGLHLHYMRRCKQEGIRRYLGLGLGFETIFSEHRHYNAMFSIGIFPWRSLALIVSPGVMFARHHDEWENEYSTHVEAVYGFMVGELEVGPVIGFAHAGEGKHYMAGLHLGKGF